MRELTKYWWILVVRGVLALLFGAVVIASPGLALTALIFTFGVWALVDGGWAIYLSFARASSGQRWGAYLFQGLLSLAVGIMTFVVPWATALGLYLLIAARAIVMGAFEIGAAIWLRKEINNEWLLVVAGVASIIFGAILLAAPPLGVIAICALIATYAFIVGAMQIALGVRLHGFERPARVIPPTVEGQQFRHV